MKRKLLLAALLVVGALGFNANAQKDVTSLYIKNATLSSKEGWNVKSFNDPVRGNNTVGWALEVWAGWDIFKNDKTFYLTQTIKLPKGNYTLVSYSFFRYGGTFNEDASTSTVDLKAGDKSVKIKTLGSITATGYANTQIEGANVFDSKMYRNTLDFSIDTDNTEIEIGLTGTFESVPDNSWCIAGMFELINNDIPATMDSPFDVTGYITNSGFEYRDMTGWNIEGEPTDQNYVIQAQGNGGDDFKVGGWYAETWQPADKGALTARSMSQKISDLPAGYYELTAYLSGDGTYVDLNGRTTYRTGTDGDYTIGYVLDENEDLTIKAGKNAEGSADFIKFDNFRLSFKGDIEAALETLAGQAGSYEGTIPAAAYTELQSVVVENNKKYSDADGYINAIAAINAQYATAETLKQPYADWKEILATANTVKAYSTKGDATDAKATFESAINDAESMAEEATEAFDIVEGKAMLGEAIQEYLVEADIRENVSLDVTFMIANPSFETGDFGGWENIGKMWIQTTAEPVRVGNSFVEFWGNFSDTKSIKQTLNSLPAGTYTLTADVISRNVTEAKVLAGEKYVDVVLDNTSRTYSIEFTCYENKDVTIGVECKGSGIDDEWIGVDNFTLALKQLGASVTAKFTTDAGYTTFSSEYTLDLSDVEAYIVTEQANGEYITLEKCTDVVAANTGLIIAGNGNVTIPVSKAEGEDLSAENYLVATDGSEVPAGNYVLARKIEDSEVGFYELSAGKEIEAGKAYLSSDVAAAGIKVLRFAFDNGTATAIEATEIAEADEDGAIYNVAGQQVAKDYKGIVIKNGKKYLNK